MSKCKDCKCEKAALVSSAPGTAARRCLMECPCLNGRREVLSVCDCKYRKVIEERNRNSEQNKS